MKKILFLMAIFVSGLAIGQNPDRFRDGIRTEFVQPDTLSTADRDNLTPKLGTILYHKDETVSQWEEWNGTAWVKFNAGSFADLTGDPYDNTLLAEDLNGKAEDDEVVHVAGNETITGTKTLDGRAIPSSTEKTLVLLDISPNIRYDIDGEDDNWVEESALAYHSFNFLTGPTQVLTTRYRLNSTGTPTNGEDLTDKDYVDAAVSGATVADGSITNAKLADMAANSFKINNTGSAATPIDGTITQVKDMLDYDASEIDYTPAGNLSATTGEGAINELDTEKGGLASNNSWTGSANIFTQSTVIDQRIYQGQHNGVSDRRWQFGKYVATIDGDFEFNRQDASSTTIAGSYTLINKINASGTPTDGNDLTDVDYVDAAVASATAVNWETASTKTLALSDAGKVFKNTGTTDYTYTVDTEASASYGGDIAFTFATYSTGAIFVQGEDGVTISPREVSTNEKPATLIRDGSNVWRWMGTTTPWSPPSFPLDDPDFVVSFYAEDLGADESAVANWPDRIGANDAVQATGGNQPKVNVEGDGKKAVDFDGTTDGLEITEVPALDFAPSDPISFVVVTGEKAFAIDQFMLHKGDTSSSTTGVEYGLYSIGSNTLRGNVYGAMGGTSGTKTTSGVDVWIVVSNGTTAEFYLNGTIVGTSWSVGTADIASNIWIGARLGASKFFSGSIRAVGIANTLLDSGQIATISGYDW